MRKFSMGLLLLWLTGLSPFLPAQEINPDAAQKFRDPSVPLADRVNDLVARLTLDEKVLQMQNQAPAIPRLGIPAYNWWSECLHGVGRNGTATVFPQAIGMAATWDPELIRREAEVISTEARAKYRDALEKGQHGVYQGLTFYTPNINIFRDPRWGRGQETYGEDPFLTGRIGVALVKGLQGNDPKYLKVVATAKHFAVHSGPESSRHSFDAWCSDRDLFETYLPAFEALVREGAVYSVMGAYNRFRSEPCCSNTFLLDDILRKKWGFRGYITTDCGAIWDIWHGHGLQPDEARSAAMGLRAGCDLTCGTEYASLPEAVKNGYITEAEIDQSVKRLLTARFKLGMFDPDSLVPWAQIPTDSNDTPSHSELARRVARESMVLLKNEGQVLPLANNLKSIAVIGPYADRVSVLLGNYNGDPSHPVTLLQGIRNRAGQSMTVGYAMGVPAPEDAFLRNGETSPSKRKLWRDALKIAGKSDVVIFVAGISPLLEGEELQVEIPGFSGGDRTTLDLPANQTELLDAIAGIGKPVVLVLVNGSALSISRESEKSTAVLEAWYPGQEGGNALADVLFGDYNPAGRLPVTFYRSVNDLPPFEDYSMKGRTYRYFKGKPLFSFGHGLSYASFAYSSPIVDKQLYAPADTIVLQVTVKNTGRMDGDEVIQVYAGKQESSFERPAQALVGFSRIKVAAGEEKKAFIGIPVKELRIYNPEAADYLVEPGTYQLRIGAASDDIRLVQTIKIR